MIDISSFKDKDGKFIALAEPGGYPVYYLDSECNIICSDCANENDTEFDLPIVAGEIYWEGSPLFCDECGSVIESAYGEPDEEEL